MPPVFPELQLSFVKLEHIILRLVLYIGEFSHYYLPSVLSFLRSLLTTSCLSPIRLILNFQVKLFAPPPMGLDWSALATVLVLPIIRYPIELIVVPSERASLCDIVSSFEQNSDLKMLLGDGRLAIFTVSHEGL